MLHDKLVLIFLLDILKEMDKVDAFYDSYFESAFQYTIIHLRVMFSRKTTKMLFPNMLQLIQKKIKDESVIEEWHGSFDIYELLRLTSYKQHKYVKGKDCHTRYTLYSLMS